LNLLKIRKAVVSDIKNIHQMINSFAKKGLMLPRSLNELYEHIRDIYLAEENDSLLGTCSLHLLWDDLAEIRSLLVTDIATNQGIGKKLLNKCITDARKLGVKRIFALTYIPDYFKKHGFTEIDKSTLPQKIWSDCLKCHKFPECDEFAVIRDI